MTRSEVNRVPGLECLRLPAGLIEDTAGDLYETATAVFSPDRQYRYALTRQWDTTMPWIAYVMLNPSTADALLLDPTVARCRSRAQRLSAGGLIVLNLFAVRATLPADMRAHDDPVGLVNDQVIDEYVRALRPLVVAGWGADVMVRRTGRDRDVLRLLDAAGAGVYRIGPATRAGHPGHPLYMPGVLSLQAHRPVA